MAQRVFQALVPAHAQLPLQYQEWIGQFTINLKNTCTWVTARMAKAFPELRVVWGMYECSENRHHPHYWCVAPGGLIVDPTVSQFPSQGNGKYHAHPVFHRNLPISHRTSSAQTK